MESESTHTNSSGHPEGYHTSQIMRELKNGIAKKLIPLETRQVKSTIEESCSWLHTSDNAFQLTGSLKVEADISSEKADPEEKQDSIVIRTISNIPSDVHIQFDQQNLSTYCWSPYYNQTPDYSTSSDDKSSSVHKSSQDQSLSVRNSLSADQRLYYGHSSSSCSNTLDALTLNTDRRNESCRTDVAVTSAHSVNPLTAIGRCICGRDFAATLTLDISHKPAIEGTIPPIETPPQTTKCIPSKRRRVDNVVDRIFGPPEYRELALPNNDNKSIIDRANFVNSPYNKSEVSESQWLSTCTRQQRKKRFDYSTNNNMASVRLDTESNCYRPVNTQPHSAIVNQKLLNHRMHAGSNSVPLQHEQLQTGQSTLVNHMSNGVPDQHFIPALKRNTSSAPPYRANLLTSRYRESGNLITDPQNSNLMRNQHFGIQNTNDHDDINLHWINNTNTRSDPGNIGSNDDIQTKHHLPVSVECANRSTNNDLRVESMVSGSPRKNLPDNIHATKTQTRKTKYLSNYLVNWEKEANVRLCWLTKGKEEGNAYCLVCGRNILIKHMGKSAVMQHIKGKQHKSRITQIETNLLLIQSGALETHLNMSDYRIPAHENLILDRTQKDELAMCEKEKQEQQEATFPLYSSLTDNSEEQTARCNCGQTEKFFQEILNVSNGEDYQHLMINHTFAAQIVSELNGVAGMMCGTSGLHGATYQSLDFSAIVATE